MTDSLYIPHTHTHSNMGVSMKKELTPEQKLALRLAQWEKAMEGDTKMLIFLGKQYLGQKDTPDMELDELPTGFNVELITPQGMGDYSIKK